MLVLPSYNEGLPVSILEAISYGMPVVATCVGDISAAIIDGENGYLVEPGDVDALANSIYKLISEKANWQKNLKAQEKLVLVNLMKLFFETILNLYRKME